MKKLLFAIMCGCLVAGGLSSCGTTEPICATSISLDRTEATLVYDGQASEKSITLHATVEPYNYNYGTITWSGGKSYDDTFVELTPSADGKSCVITGVKEITSGINVYAKINGKSGELTAVCDVKVTHAVRHISYVDFTESTKEKTIAVGESVNIPYLQNTNITDDDVYVTINGVGGNKTIAAGLYQSNVVVSGVWAGDSTIQLKAYYNGEATGVQSQIYTIHVSEPTSCNVTAGSTVTTDVSLVSTETAKYSYYKFTAPSDITISKTNPLSIKLTPRGSSAVDLDNYKVTVGIKEKFTMNWIVFGQNTSEATYTDETSTQLKSGTDYYITVLNSAAIASADVSLHITLPNA